MIKLLAYPFCAAALGVLVAWFLGRKREPQKESFDNPVWVRRQVLASVSIGGAASAVLTLVLYVGCDQATSASFCKAATSSPPWTLISGVAAVPSLVLLWGWRTQQRGIDQTQKGKELQHQREAALSGKFAEAVKLIAEPSSISRIAGIYALREVAASEGSYADVAVATLAAFVRERRPFDLANVVTQSVAEDFERHKVPTDVQNALSVALELRGSEPGRSLSLQKSDLCGAHLIQANLAGAYLVQARLDYANLRNAVLRGASLAGARMLHAQLQSADFRSANMMNVVLTFANCEGGDFRGTTFIVAELEGARWQGAKFDDKTSFPRSFDPLAHGMVRVPDGTPDSSSA